MGFRLGSVSVKAKGGNNHISKSISERLDSLVKDKDLIGKPIKREFLIHLKIMANIHLELLEFYFQPMRNPGLLIQSFF